MASAALDSGTYSEVADKSITVGIFLRDRWLPAARSGATKAGTPRRSNTIARYEIAVNSWLVPHSEAPRIMRGG